MLNPRSTERAKGTPLPERGGKEDPDIILHDPGAPGAQQAVRRSEAHRRTSDQEQEPK